MVPGSLDASEHTADGAWTAETPPTEQLLSDFARTLHELAQTTGAPVMVPSAVQALQLSGFPMPAATTSRPASHSARGDDTDAEPAAMPQILLYPSSATADRDASPPDWRRSAQFVAPAILALSLCSVAVLMFASASGVSSLLGSAGSLAASKGTTSEITWSTTGDTIGRTVATLEAAAAAHKLALGLDDLVLMERTESMIALGDIAGARRELAAAAATGNPHARFALAESFDPNVLAARGMRTPVADAGTARTLYEQSLAGGDTRALRRLEQLERGQ